MGPVAPGSPGRPGMPGGPAVPEHHLGGSKMKLIDHTAIICSSKNLFKVLNSWLDLSICGSEQNYSHMRACMQQQQKLTTLCIY